MRDQTVKWEFLLKKQEDRRIVKEHNKSWKPCSLTLSEQE